VLQGRSWLVDVHSTSLGDSGQLSDLGLALPLAIMQYLFSPQGIQDISGPWKVILTK